MSNPPLPPAGLILGDDPLGLDAWANSCVVAPHTAIAVAASILAGVAGPLGRLPAKAPVLSTGINLAGRQDDSFLRMAIDGLVSPLLQFEEALVAKAKEKSPEEVDNAMFVPNRKRVAADLTKLGEPGPLDQELADFNSLSRLEGDAKISDQSVRYECFLRSRFVMAGHAPSSLIRVLSGFHYGYGLLGGAVENLPREKSKRHQRLDEILRCFHGTEAATSGKGKSAKITPESVSLKGVVLFPADQFDWLATARRDFLSHTIPVASLPLSADLAPADEIRAVGFVRLFHGAAKHALASRRAHAPVIVNFHSDAALVKFLDRQRTYLRELQSIPENLRVSSAAALPVTLTWTLLLLAGKLNLDDYILEIAFAAARNIVKDARELFVRYDQQALGENRLKNVRKLHKRLAQNGPLPRWELLRGLDQQSLQVHGPVIRVLIDLGVFTQDDKNLLHLGTAPLHQVTAKHLIDLDGPP